MSHPLRRLLRKALPAAVGIALLIPSAGAAGVPLVPGGYTSPFTDVASGAWYYPFVSSLNHQGVVHGYDDGRFGPEDTVRTGDAVLMVVKAAGSGDQPARAGEHYASGYVRCAWERGWLEGEALPDLDSPAPRLLVARLAARALSLEPAEQEAGASPFADVDDPLATTLYRAGLMAGSMEGERRLFQPQNPMTRGELSAIVWRVQGYGRRIPFGRYELDILDAVPACSWSAGDFSPAGDRMEYAAAKTALGVDVSYYQGEIDWERVAADGIEFAMIRAGGRYYGSGGLFEDTRFRSNMEGALAAGLETGVYFFSQAISEQEAREEAEFLLELLEGYQFTGPVVFDWENIDNAPARTDGLSQKTLTAAANAFCTMVEEGGCSPMIYFNRHIAYLLYDLEGVARYPFWLAEYGETPAFYYDFQIWQYTDSGQVDGIRGPVDLNIKLVK